VSAGHDHLADVERLRQLHAKPVPLNRRLDGIVRGTAALTSDTCAWGAFAPTAKQIDAALVQLSGLQREIKLLRGELYPDQANPPSAA
jgi:hypothetical protein